jgi:excisionase family DNA binding protein
MSHQVKDLRVPATEGLQPAAATVAATRKIRELRDVLPPSGDPRAFGLVKAAYSVRETLNLLSIGRTTFYQLVNRGDLKITKLGKKSLVYATDIAGLLVSLRAKSGQH